MPPMMIQLLKYRVHTVLLFIFTSTNNAKNYIYWEVKIESISLKVVTNKRQVVDYELMKKEESHKFEEAHPVKNRKNGRSAVI